MQRVFSTAETVTTSIDTSSIRVQAGAYAAMREKPEPPAEWTLEDMDSLGIQVVPWDGV